MAASPPLGTAPQEKLRASAPSGCCPAPKHDNHNENANRPTDQLTPGPTPQDELRALGLSAEALVSYWCCSRAWLEVRGWGWGQGGGEGVCIGAGGRIDVHPTRVSR